MSKTDKVLAHLKTYGSITSLEAIDNYSATRLSAIIFNLRKKGYNITSVPEEFTDSCGNTGTYSRYVLNGVPEKPSPEDDLAVFLKELEGGNNG